MDAGKGADAGSGSFLMRVEGGGTGLTDSSKSRRRYVSIPERLQEGIFCVITFSILSIRHSPNLCLSSYFSLMLSYTNITASTQAPCLEPGRKSLLLR